MLDISKSSDSPLDYRQCVAGINRTKAESRWVIRSCGKRRVKLPLIIICFKLDQTTLDGVRWIIERPVCDLLVHPFVQLVVNSS